MGQVVRLFPLRGAWSAKERGVLTDMQRAFMEQGVATNCEHGFADDGSPWTVFYESHRGRFVAHVARDTRSYLLMWPDRTSERTAEMAHLIQIVRGRSRLRLCSGTTGGGE